MRLSLLCWSIRCALVDGSFDAVFAAHRGFEAKRPAAATFNGSQFE
jgi:hypothetical protein